MAAEPVDVHPLHRARTADPCFLAVGLHSRRTGGGAVVAGRLVVFMPAVASSREVVLPVPADASASTAVAEALVMLPMEDGGALALVGMRRGYLHLVTIAQGLGAEPEVAVARTLTVGRAVRRGPRRRAWWARSHRRARHSP